MGDVLSSPSNQSEQASKISGPIFISAVQSLNGFVFGSRRGRQTAARTAAAASSGWAVTAHAARRRPLPGSPDRPAPLVSGTTSCPSPHQDAQQLGLQGRVPRSRHRGTYPGHSPAQLRAGPHPQWPFDAAQPCKVRAANAPTSQTGHRSEGQSHPRSPRRLPGALWFDHQWGALRPQRNVSRGPGSVGEAGCPPAPHGKSASVSERPALPRHGPSAHSLSHSCLLRQTLGRLLHTGSVLGAQRGTNWTSPRPW